MERFLQNPILKELVERGVEVTIKRDGFEINGFYKSGTVLLKPNPGEDSFTAVARYNETDQIETFDDLVHLNHYWWRRSKERHEGWNTPESPWKEIMLEKGLIKENVQIIKSYS